MEIVAALLLAIQAPAQFMQQADPMSDEVLSLAMVSDGENGFGIGCRGRGKLRLVFVAGRHLVSTNWLTSARPFMFRLDQDEPVTSDWYYDGRIAEQYSGPQLRRFVARILTASRLRVRAYDYDNRSIDVEFQIVDIREPIRRVLEICDDRRAREQIAPLLRGSN